VGAEAAAVAIAQRLGTQPKQRATVGHDIALLLGSRLPVLAQGWPHQRESVGDEAAQRLRAKR
jgi:hypothetical protein